MTTKEALKRFEKIKKLSKTDNESAHCEEDTFYTDVLQAIVDGAENYQELAKIALNVWSLSYERWYG